VAELHPVAEGVEIVQSLLKIEKLGLIPLGDDPGTGLFPERNAAGVVPVGVGEDDVPEGIRVAATEDRVDRVRW